MVICSAGDDSYLVDVAGGLLTLTFNRPEFGNALAAESVDELVELFRQAQTDSSIRAIAVRGKGKVFSAGGNVSAFSKSLEQDTVDRQADFALRLSRLGKLVEAVAAFDRPLVAVVRGAVAGAGLLFPLAADFTIGDETAAFVFAHQRVGLSPDAGVSILLPRVVGERTARMLLMTAAKLDSVEAHRLGILNRLVTAEALESESSKLLSQFVRAPQIAITATKKLVAAAIGRSLPEQLDAERDAIIECVGDPDFSEGVRAFIEKRPAAFPSAG